MSARASAAAPARAQDLKIVPHHQGGYQWLARADAYSVALAFVNREIEVHGDIVAAVRFQLSRSESTWQRQFFDAICRLRYAVNIGLPQTALTVASQITSASQPYGHVRALTSPMKQGINLVIDRSSPGHDQKTRAFSPKLRREQRIDDRRTRNIPNESRREQ
jgi:hypothetical protein